MRLHRRLVWMITILIAGFSAAVVAFFDSLSAQPVSLRAARRPPPATAFSPARVPALGLRLHPAPYRPAARFRFVDAAGRTR